MHGKVGRTMRRDRSLPLRSITCASALMVLPRCKKSLARGINLDNAVAALHRPGGKACADYLADSPAGVAITDPLKLSEPSSG